MRFVALDTETGGLDPQRHPLIQIAAVAVSNLEVVETFERKLSFDLETADPEALRHNSFDHEVWKREMVEPREAATELSGFMRRHQSVEMFSKRTGQAYLLAQVVGHNIRFDLDFLRVLFEKYGLFRPWSPVALDTMQLAAWAQFAGGSMGDLYALERPASLPKSLKLTDLCAHYGIEIKAHDALSDVMACVELVRVMTRRTNSQRSIGLDNRQWVSTGEC